MYPYLRLAKELWAHRKAPPLDVTGTHVSHHRCWPQDIDPWMELNNGRTLTLYDLGRIPYAVRTGLRAAVQREGWGSPSRATLRAIAAGCDCSTGSRCARGPSVGITASSISSKACGRMASAPATCSCAAPSPRRRESWPPRACWPRWDCLCKARSCPIGCKPGSPPMPNGPGRRCAEGSRLRGAGFACSVAANGQDEAAP